MGERLTSNNGLFYAEMQTDGNFVVYSSGNSNALWASSTMHSGFSHLVLQDDGNLVIYRPDNQGENVNPGWASNTCGQDNNLRLDM